jgi:UDP-3-O-[3-hydroxymyristoyl] glucosamine N-acyltransferase
MNDSCFLERAEPLTLADLVAHTGAKAAAGADLAVLIERAAPLEDAEPGELACLADPRDIPLLEATRAAACFVPSLYLPHVPARCQALVTEEPERAFAQALAALYPRVLRPGSLFAAAGANPGASIHPEARLEPGVVIDPGAVIGPRAEIGSGSIIAANSVIGPDVCIGRDCCIGANVTITHALIGDRVILHPGIRIGQDGFAFAPGRIRHLKVPHIGRVIIQDDVEIGANATVDRGVVQDSVIGEGTKVGAQARIGPNVVIGRHCLVGAQAGLDDGLRLGDFFAVSGGSGEAEIPQPSAAAKLAD